MRIEQNERCLVCYFALQSISSGNNDGRGDDRAKIFNRGGESQKNGK